MLENTPSPHPEIAKPETIAQMHEVINRKFDNPTVRRKVPNLGKFVFQDASRDGHDQDTEVDIILENGTKYISLSEGFKESTPRFKPSVLVSDFELSPTSLEFVIEEEYDQEEDRGAMALTRLYQLKHGALKLPPAVEEDGLTRYALSEENAQQILASLKEMLIPVE